MPNVIRLVRLNDATVAGVFIDLFSALDAKSLQFFHLGGSTWEFPPDEMEDDDPENSDQSEDFPYSSSEYLIDRAELALGRQCVIVFSRGLFDPNQINNGNDKTINLGNFRSFRLSSNINDEIYIHGAIDEISKIKSFDEIVSKLRYNLNSREDSEDSLTAIVTNQLDQLRALSLDFTKRQIEAEAGLEAAFKKREDALLKRIANEDGRLAEIAAHNEEKLAKERAALEKWREEINDREPQHERRELRKSLTKKLTDLIS